MDEPHVKAALDAYAQLDRVPKGNAEATANTQAWAASLAVKAILIELVELRRELREARSQTNA